MNTVLKPSRNASGENADSPRYTAPALEKGLDILDVLVDTAEGYTLNELSVKLGRTVSEIFRMVVTLERRGIGAAAHQDILRRVEDHQPAGVVSRQHHRRAERCERPWRCRSCAISRT